MAEEVGEIISGGITKVDGRLEGGDDSFSVVPQATFSDGRFATCLKQQSEHLKLWDSLTRL
jgi:hypothetical protein